MLIGAVEQAEQELFIRGADHVKAPESPQLAANISLALVTTMQGLVVAIPCVILYSFFRNRIDAIAADAGNELDQLAMLLESAQSGGGERPGADARPAAPFGSGV